MCGISGILDLDKGQPLGAVERMIEALSHRGPDSRGYKLFPGYHMGHTRLSIIDLESGAQPMSDANGRYWITFNGEIYNYKELRAQLILKGHKFKTCSDTEAILVSYEEWGFECLNRFRGMFAFAIWDTEERALFAARDPLGEKPFYYSLLQGGTFVLASEIKAIIASGMVTPKLDLDSVDAYLMSGYVPPDRTIYENINTLPPGHYLVWRNNCVKVTRYWVPRFDTRQISLEEAAERLRELMLQSVRRQMVADVPVGAFLSGGLDSSTVVALMQKESLKPVKTFSVGFGDYINELPYARAVAKLYNTEHHEIDLGTPPVAELLERMSQVYDEPFADSSNIPTYLMSQFARRFVKVVLSGDGGDELFGGYWWYLPLALSEKMPGSFVKWAVLRFASRIFYGKNLRLRSVASGFAARWPDMWMRSIMCKVVFKAQERRSLWGDTAPRVSDYVPSDYYKPPAGTSGLNRSFYFDLTSYLPGDILVKIDRAAMACGLETRTPFLDRDLVEFSLSLPARLKVDQRDTKIVFKSACAKFWPPQILGRAKQGFGAPYNKWLSFPEVVSLKEKVFSNNSRLLELLPGARAKFVSQNPYKVWVLLTLGLWLEQEKYRNE